jgi:hypothetical protein
LVTPKSNCSGEIGGYLLTDPPEVPAENIEIEALKPKRHKLPSFIEEVSSRDSPEADFGTFNVIDDSISEV